MRAAVPFGCGVILRVLVLKQLNTLLYHLPENTDYTLYMRWVRLAILIPAVAALLPAQTFEVASVKLSAPHSQRGSQGGPGSKDPGRYTFNAANLDDLIAVAYHVDYFQISSKAALDQQLFDLSAKVPEGATKEQFRLMLQNLLAERFHLKAHVESRDFPGYELTVAKTGFKPKEPKALDDFPTLPAGRPGLTSRHTSSGGSILIRTRVQQQTMASFASSLQPPDGEPVVDRTGLPGKYDFTFEYAHDIPNAPAGSQRSLLPDLFSALQQQLGLQLIHKKVPFDVVVVEAIDKLPTEN